jgi:hypothetical protein
MNMRVVVPPPWQSIMARALGCGAAYGASLGVATLAALSFAAGALWLGLVPAFWFFWLLAALVGVIVGLACGIVGGTALVVLRRQAAGSRAVVRLIAGVGAALLPGACAVLQPANGPVSVFLTSITVVTFGVGVARGPRIFYGKPRKRKRRADAPASAVGG